MKVRLEDLPPHAQAQVLAQLQLRPAQPKKKSVRRESVVVKAPIFCTRCGSYEHCAGDCPYTSPMAIAKAQGFAVPVRTSSEQNREMGKHWSVHAGKRSQVRDAIGKAWLAAGIVLRPAGYRVTITRISHPLADALNLQSCLKSVVDEVAARMRVDDDSPLVEWKLERELGKPGLPAVRVTVEEMP